MTMYRERVGQRQSRETDRGRQTERQSQTGRQTDRRDESIDNTSLFYTAYDFLCVCVCVCVCVRACVRACVRVDEFVRESMRVHVCVKSVSPVLFLVI